MTGETLTGTYPAKPCKKSDVKIIALAESLAHSRKYASAEYLHVLASQLGGTIEITTEDDLKSKPGQLLVYPEGNFTIYNPIGWPYKKERYMIANEIAHRELHFKKGQPGVMVANFSLDLTKESDDSSKEADRQSKLFARYLIMPAKEFEKTFNYWYEKINSGDFTNGQSSDDRKKKLLEILSIRYLVDETVIEQHINELKLPLQ